MFVASINVTNATEFYSKTIGTLPDGRYVTMEAYDNYLEIWVREQPEMCSYKDELKFRINVKELSKSIDAVTLAKDCTECAFWITAGSLCSVATAGLTIDDSTFVGACNNILLPFSARCAFEAYGNAWFSCSKCGSDSVKILIKWVIEEES
ncbi:MAG: hypothetical protein J7K36_05475 [Archaeoglobaceae archaeon]|nr:hypothetical protein [Archaeoglobaceae archaeon]